MWLFRRNPDKGVKRKHIAVSSELMAALNFTADDLLANREGELTPTQREYLTRCRDKSAANSGWRSFSAITEKGRYTVYMTPRTRLLLSLEPAN